MRTTLIAGLAIGLLGSAVAAGAGEKRAFSIADHYRVQPASDPQPSPDGARVVYVVTHTDLEAGRKWSELWLVGTDGGAVRQLTAGAGSSHAARWSPDGGSIAFLSDRDGGEDQLYLLPMTGGEARRVTSFAPGVADPVWSPDGRFVAVSARVYPECGADGACNERIGKAWSEGKLAAHLADGLLYRHWSSWRDATYSHVLLVRLADGVLTDLTPGAFDAPTFSLGGDIGYAFAPDSRELAYVSNHDPDPAESTNADIFTVSLGEDGTPGEAVRITAANPGWDGSPAYSPDGRQIAYRTQLRPRYEADCFRLALYDRRTGTSRVVTERFDNWVTSLAWRPGGGLLFAAAVEARTPLFRVDADGVTREVLRDGTIDSWQPLPGGDGVVYARRRVDEPAELARSSLDGRPPIRLTQHNDTLLSEVDVRPAEEMWVEVGGGRKVHVFVVKPHGFDPAVRYPLILNVHGGPQDQWQDSYRGDWQVYPGAGYVVAFANPTGSNGYGQATVDAISHDWGGRVYEELMKVTDALARLPYVDPTRLGAMGWSYGGYMMMWFEGHTDRFRAIAAMMGLYDLATFHGTTEELWFPQHDLGGRRWESGEYARWSPSAFVRAFKTPCLVVTGERDYRVPYTQSLQFFTDLQEMKVPSRLAVFAKAGHWPSWYEMAFYYDLHLDWFHRYLGGAPAPWDVEKLLRNQVFGK